MAYLSLSEKSRYLKAVLTEGKNKALRGEEITSCEEYAEAIIEGRLGKSWAPGSVPKIIEHVADLLGSAKAYDFLHTGQAPVQSEYAKSLRDQAKELLKEISDGEIGLKLPDGTWDNDYPGPSVEDKEPDGIEVIL